ncbi:MAG: hypothetical protein ACON5N_19205 [Akkermansiaceae bacterium]
MKRQLGMITAGLCMICGTATQSLVAEEVSQKRGVPSHVQQYLKAKHLLDGISF